MGAKQGINSFKKAHVIGGVLTEAIKAYNDPLLSFLKAFLSKIIMIACTRSMWCKSVIVFKKATKMMQTSIGHFQSLSK